MTRASTSVKRKRRAYAPRVPAEQRRSELLDAALNLVVSEGHGAVTMERVADEAGVTKPVVYGQFASRSELLSQLLRREQTLAMAQVIELVPGGLEGLASDPGDLLARMLADFLDVVRHAPGRWHCIVMPMADMPPEFIAARERGRSLALERGEGVMRMVLRALGAPKELDPEIVTQALLSVFEMAARLTLSDPDHFRPERFVGSLRAAVGLVQLQ